MSEKFNQTCVVEKSFTAEAEKPEFGNQAMRIFHDSFVLLKLVGERKNPIWKMRLTQVNSR